MKTKPPINIIGVYLETNQSSEKAEKTHKIITEKVQRRVDEGDNCVIMGDMNAAVNPDCNQLTPAARLILDSENSEQQIKGQQENCLGLAIITPGLEKCFKSFTLDTKRERTPSTLV